MWCNNLTPCVNTQAIMYNSHRRGASESDVKLVIEFSKGMRMTPAGAGSIMPGMPPGAIPRALSRGEGERDNHGSTCFLAHCQLGLSTRKPPFRSIVNPNCVRYSMLPLYKFRERKNGVQTRIWPLNVDPPATPRTLIHGESVLRCCPVKFALCINDD